MAGKIPPVDWERVDALVAMALSEDLGDAGDVTTGSVIPAEAVVAARLIAKEECVCAGLPVAERVFHAVDPNIEWRPLVSEGEVCAEGAVMAELRGRARGILTAERTALNFLQRLSGVATMAFRYQAALAGTATVVLDTRKTTPGYRNLEKYAVATGGAGNHRIGLYDRVMIKDNHRELAGLEGAGGILRSVRRARAAHPGLEVEVEVDGLDELAEALESGAEYILLDNMSDADMAEAVRRTAGRAKLEASGGITLSRLPSIGQLGVDYVSAGALTHSVKSADISLDVVPA